jgi:transcription elongation factor GreA
VNKERKEAIAEVQRGAEMGDFSENVGYQIAKANLRRLNARILNLEERIKQAIPIESGTDKEGRIRIGSTVTLRTQAKEMTYQILGSQESNPAKGFISHGSPLGKLLVGKRVGDDVTLSLPHGETIYHILNVT